MYDDAGRWYTQPYADDESSYGDAGAWMIKSGSAMLPGTFGDPRMGSGGVGLSLSPGGPRSTGASFAPAVSTTTTLGNKIKQALTPKASNTSEYHRSYQGGRPRLVVRVWRRPAPGVPERQFSMPIPPPRRGELRSSYLSALRRRFDKDVLLGTKAVDRILSSAKEHYYRKSEADAAPAPKPSVSKGGGASTTFQPSGSSAPPEDAPVDASDSAPDGSIQGQILALARQLGVGLTQEQVDALAQMLPATGEITPEVLQAWRDYMLGIPPQQPGGQLPSGWTPQQATPAEMVAENERSFWTSPVAIGGGLLLVGLVGTGVWYFGFRGR